MRAVAAAALAALVTGCLTYAATGAQEQRSARELQRELAGKVAGQPLRCLQPHRTRDMQAIDPNTILFRDGRTTYVARMNGSCSGLGSPGYILITRSIGGSSLCSGDIAQVADSASRMVVGGCAFGDFVPYRSPR